MTQDFCINILLFFLPAASTTLPYDFLALSCCRSGAVKHVHIFR